jgi:MYXO-CTERM domain-containing protein
MKARFSTLAAATLSLPLALPIVNATVGGGLSDSETSYKGAIILEGDLDVSFEQVTPSVFATNGEDPDAVEQHTYGYFTGNTLYAGAYDDDDNSVDAIVEFFWFESSWDRGSDFYVAVIKARTSPGPGMALDSCTRFTWCEGPALAVYTDTNIESQNGAFRWDWSLPFDNYGIDAYGEVTFTNAYGIGASAEGAVMAHGEYPITEDGSVKAAGNVQAKGYVSSEYKIQTQYQVTLWRWEMEVQGSASYMDWALTLNNTDREMENAYHEYFLVMQVEEGEPFTIDHLDVLGTVDPGWGLWWNDAKALGLTIKGIELNRPDYTPPAEDDDWNDTGIWWDTGWEDEGNGNSGWNWGNDDEADSQDGDINDPFATESNVQEDSWSGLGCSTRGGAPTRSGLVLAALGLVGLLRRRKA